MDPRPTSSPNLAAYQAKYRERNPLLRYANQRFLQTAQAMVQGLQVRRWLDVGCGEGVVFSRLQRSLPGQGMGLDVDPARVAQAREGLPEARLAVGDAHHLPFPDGAFDLVVMLEILEHVGDPARAVSEAQRVCSRYLLASVPHEPWWRLANMARLKYLRDWGNTPEHINHWSRRGFLRLLQGHFHPLKVRNPLVWTFVLAERRD
jgi:ubiquinone/menaquinone biosynthesis C-methylase UbiE